MKSATPRARAVLHLVLAPVGLVGRRPGLVVARVQEASPEGASLARDPHVRGAGIEDDLKGGIWMRDGAQQAPQVAHNFSEIGPSLAELGRVSAGSSRIRPIPGQTGVQLWPIPCQIRPTSGQMSRAVQNWSNSADPKPISTESGGILPKCIEIGPTLWQVLPRMVTERRWAATAGA